MEVYDSGEIPEGLRRFIFRARPKKPSENKCELHRTIFLMRNITKLILKILINRNRSRINSEMGQEQCDAVKINTTFMIRMLSEQAVPMQKDLYLFFIVHKSI